MRSYLYLRRALRRSNQPKRKPERLQANRQLRRRSEVRGGERAQGRARARGRARPKRRDSIKSHHSRRGTTPVVEDKKKLPLQMKAAHIAPKKKRGALTTPRL